MVDYLRLSIGRLLKRLKRPCWKRGRRVTAAWVRIPCLPFILKDTQEILGIFFLYACFITRVNFLENVK